MKKGQALDRIQLTDESGPIDYHVFTYMKYIFVKDGYSNYLCHRYKKSSCMKPFLILFALLSAFSSRGQQFVIDDIYALLPADLLVKNKVKKIIHQDLYSTNKLHEISLRSDGQPLSVFTQHNKRRDTTRAITSFEYDDEGNLMQKTAINEATKDTLLHQVNQYEEGRLVERKLHLLNGIRKETFNYNADAKLINKLVKHNNYSAIQEFDEQERTIKYSRKYNETEESLETAFVYKKDTVWVLQYYEEMLDTTIIELNENAYPIYAGNKGIMPSHREQYLYYDNGLIKSIVHRRKARHTFKYEFAE